MKIAALVGVLTAFLAAAPAAAQTSIPWEPPKPLGGPIRGPDGKELPVLERKTPWSGSVEVGINGSEGNTQVLAGRAGVDLRYETPEDRAYFSLLYNLTRQDSNVTQNRGIFTGRNELPFAEQWAWFVQAQAEYDEFRDASLRLASHSGLTYSVFDTKETSLKFRAGLGAAKEFGGPRNEWIPEGQLGGEYMYRLSERTRFTVAADYFPDLHDARNFRVRSRAALDVLVDPSLNMVLRLGVQDRYDSIPGQAKRNDLDYFMTLVFQF